MLKEKTSIAYIVLIAAAVVAIICVVAFGPTERIVGL